MNYDINRLIAEGRIKEMRDYAYQNNLVVSLKKVKQLNSQKVKPINKEVV
ncbi:hypothetical protein H8S33_11140 [Ornithinibacillus sp. BX22]|uniref:Uncharacterized protein n=2 Tax=Ornithinibacillus TaxID=484508 RepID=A0A923L6P1_9BACI|nr:MULTISPECIES: hypothetical protein [Ornithinibacillus]MBC5637360.1 hypothetical protein [Ornithinibacillus hominis]MBS3680332.1 hypothetical protein [Ornithinibacillus massiliensis]